MNKDVQEIGFSKVQLYTKQYKVLGWKRTRRNNGKIEVNKKFIRLLPLWYDDLEQGTPPEILAAFPIRLHAPEELLILE